MSDDPYVYPGTNVLKNKLNICDAALLDYHERELVVQRIRQGVPKGDFDLAHLRAIHRHLFQDIYDWAGEIRTVEISKGGQHFQARRYIPTGMDYVHRRIAAAGYFQALPKSEFAARAGETIGDVNHAHPFREGNGRTQLQYLKLLAERAGHAIDLRKLDKKSWIDASREANEGRYDAMQRAIEAALGGRKPPE